MINVLYSGMEPWLPYDADRRERRARFIGSASLPYGPVVPLECVVGNVSERVSSGNNLGLMSYDGSNTDFDPAIAAYGAFNIATSYSAGNHVEAHDVTNDYVAKVPSGSGSIVGISPTATHFVISGYYIRNALGIYWNLQDGRVLHRILKASGHTVGWNAVAAAESLETPARWILANMETPFVAIFRSFAKLPWAILTTAAGSDSARSFTATDATGYGATAGRGYNPASYILGASVLSPGNLGHLKNVLGMWYHWAKNVTGLAKPAELSACITQLDSNWTAGSNWRGVTTNDASFIVSGNTGAAGNLLYTSASSNLAVGTGQAHWGRFLSWIWAQMKASVSEASFVQWGDTFCPGLIVVDNSLPTSTDSTGSGLYLDIGAYIVENYSPTCWPATGVITTTGGSWANYYPLDLLEKSLTWLHAGFADNPLGGLALSNVLTRYVADGRTGLAGGTVARAQPISCEVKLTRTGTETWNGNLASGSTAYTNGLRTVDLSYATGTVTLTLTFVDAATRATWETAVGLAVTIGGITIHRTAAGSGSTLVYTVGGLSGSMSVGFTVNPSGGVTPADNPTLYQGLIRIPWGVASATGYVRLSFGKSSSSNVQSGVTPPVQMHACALSRASKLSAARKWGALTYVAGKTYTQKDQDHSGLSYVTSLLDSLHYEQLSKHLEMTNNLEYADAFCPQMYPKAPPRWMATYGCEIPQFMAPAVFGTPDIKDLSVPGKWYLGIKSFDSPDASTSAKQTDYESFYESVQSWLKVARNLLPSKQVVPTISWIGNWMRSNGAYDMYAPKEFAYYIVRPWLMGAYKADALWLWASNANYLDGCFSSNLGEYEQFRQGIENAFFAGSNITLAEWAAPTTTAWNSKTSGGFGYVKYGSAARAALGYTTLEGTDPTNSVARIKMYLAKALDFWLQDLMTEVKIMAANPSAYPEPSRSSIGYEKPTFSAAPSSAQGSGLQVVCTIPSLVHPNPSNTTNAYSVRFLASPNGNDGTWIEQQLVTGSAPVPGTVTMTTTAGLAAGWKVRALVQVSNSMGGSNFGGRSTYVTNTVTLA